MLAGAGATFKLGPDDAFATMADGKCFSGVNLSTEAQIENTF